jgi:hypothetical protein
MGQTGFSWLRIGSSGGLLWTWWWTFRFHKKVGYFLTSWVTISFSNNILHHAVSEWFKVRPFQGNFWFWRHEKVTWSISDGCSGCFNTGIWFLAKNCFTKSAVNIALGYKLDAWGSRVSFPVGAGYFSLHHHVQNGSGAHPASYQWVPGALSLGIKQPGHEAYH